MPPPAPSPFSVAIAAQARSTNRLARFLSHYQARALDRRQCLPQPINAALLHFIEQLRDHIVDTAKDADTLPKPPTMIQNAEKIYNIDHIDNANFS